MGEYVPANAIKHKGGGDGYKTRYEIKMSGEEMKEENMMKDKKAGSE